MSQDIKDFGAAVAIIVIALSVLLVVGNLVQRI